jgi:endonuclease/exonuclease/phosphatase family metal-dependent hydrolase
MTSVFALDRPQASPCGHSASAAGSQPIGKTADTPPIASPLPQDRASGFAALSTALDETIPARQLDRNLLVATWNLRAFGGLTPKWRSEPGDSPRRDLFDLRCIAEIVSRFDVVAIEEAREDLSALRLVLEALGDSWGLIATDVTRGRAGNSERLVFLFDTRRLRPSGLAGELVVALEEETDLTASDLQSQFARTPYAVSFTTGREELTLVVLHVLWGKNEAERVPELREIASWLADWPRREETWSKNLIALGDFNVNKGPLYDALTATGLTTPSELDAVPRTIFDSSEKQHFYDQIAWFAENGNRSVLSLGFLSAGSFDFVPLLQGGLSKNQLSWKVSDHYPLWVEFSVRGDVRAS